MTYRIPSILFDLARGKLSFDELRDAWKVAGFYSAYKKKNLPLSEIKGLKFSDIRNAIRVHNHYVVDRSQVMDTEYFIRLVRQLSDMAG